MRNLTTLYQQYLADGRKALTEYSYKRVSIVGNLGGLSKDMSEARAYKPGHTIYNGDCDDPILVNERND